MAAITPTVGKFISVHVSRYIMQQKDLASRDLIGRVEQVTARAFLLHGSASTLPAAHCHRCGLLIKNLISRAVGYGPVCSGYLGIDRNLTEDEVEAHRERIARETEGSWWFPLRTSQVTLPTEEDLLLLNTRFSFNCTDCDTRLPTGYEKRQCLLCLNELAIGYEAVVRRLTKRYGHTPQQEWRHLRVLEEQDAVGAR